MPLIEELKEKTRRNKDIAATFRLAVPGGSELLLVMKRADRRKKERAAKTILDVSQRYPVQIRIETTDLDELKKSPELARRILREAELISGEPPELTLSQLNIKPFTIISYSLTNLSQSQKMQLKRELFGKRTVKKYKEKSYLSQKEGVLKAAGGKKLGKGALMLPQPSRNMIMDALKRNNVVFEAVDVWL